MLSEQVQEDWNFAPVHDFLRLTSLTERPSVAVSLVDHSLPDRYNTASHLGDFGRIWEHLGQPLSVPPPTIQLLPCNETTTRIKADIEIKATAYDIPKGKEVKWNDEHVGGDLTNDDGLGNSKIVPFSKASRRQKAHRRSELNELERNHQKSLPSGSENESENDIWTAERSQARKAIIDRVIHNTPENADRFASTLLLPSGAPQLPVIIGTSLATSLRILARTEKPFALPEESVYAEAAGKNERLMAKLHEAFVEERQYLRNINFLSRTTTGDDGANIGVHVFVDASNIMIGFHNAIKLSRGLSISSRLRRQPLSFHNLSLVLERGRPPAKRVLVGSDNFPAIQEARAIGYETNILDRVHKAKELTPRQKKFTHVIPNGTYHAASGQSSGSETNAATRAPEKWVEQAVDEILHLKILESVVDAKKPSTMVLATGDAAEAEYSQGFLKMVERALEKGWSVELVSFKHNISGMYKRKEFRGRWGQRFKIIELDDFVDELLVVQGTL